MVTVLMHSIFAHLGVSYLAYLESRISLTWPLPTAIIVNIPRAEHTMKKAVG
jgi:hypothetical protein